MDRCRVRCDPVLSPRGCEGPLLVPTCKVVVVSHWFPVPSTSSGCHTLMVHCQIQEPSTGLHCYVLWVCLSTTSPVDGVLFPGRQLVVSASGKTMLAL